MSERIVVRDEKGDLVTKDGGRIEGKLYSQVGTDSDGTIILREWSDDEATARATEEQAPKVESKRVDFATCLERLLPEEFAVLAAVEGADPKFKWWMLRAASQGYVNTAAPEFLIAREAIVRAGLIAEKRFDELFAA
jgi:hypothetical protein